VPKPEPDSFFAVVQKCQPRREAAKVTLVSLDEGAPVKVKVQRVDAAVDALVPGEQTLEVTVDSMKDMSNRDLTANGNLKLGLLIKAAIAAVGTGSDLKEEGVSGGLEAGQTCSFWSHPSSCDFE